MQLCGRARVRTGQAYTQTWQTRRTTLRSRPTSAMTVHRRRHPSTMDHCRPVRLRRSPVYTRVLTADSHGPATAQSADSLAPPVDSPWWVYILMLVADSRHTRKRQTRSSSWWTRCSTRSPVMLTWKKYAPAILKKFVSWKPGLTWTNSGKVDHLKKIKNSQSSSNVSCMSLVTKASSCYRFVGANSGELGTTHDCSEKSKHEAFEDKQQSHDQNECRRSITFCTKTQFP